MKNRIKGRSIIIGIAMALLFCGDLSPALGQTQKERSLTGIHWLLGTWQMTVKKGTLYESWHMVNDSTFQSKGYLVKPSADTVLQEAVQLTCRNGVMYYTPTVNGQNNGQAVSFKITSLKQNEFIAENPEHDFPQRIIYRLDAPKKLYASVEGNYKGKFAKEEYFMVKVVIRRRAK